MSEVVGANNGFAEVLGGGARLEQEERLRSRVASALEEASDVECGECWSEDETDPDLLREGPMSETTAWARMHTSPVYMTRRESAHLWEAATGVRGVRTIDDSQNHVFWLVVERLRRLPPVCRVPQLVACTNHGLSPFIRDWQGRTLAHAFAQFGMARCMAWARLHNLHLLCDNGNNTPLHVAAEYDKEGVVHALQIMGLSNINQENVVGATALETAVRCGSWAVLRLLVAWGADAACMTAPYLQHHLDAAPEDVRRLFAEEE